MTPLAPTTTADLMDLEWPPGEEAAALRALTEAAGFPWRSQRPQTSSGSAAAAPGPMAQAISAPADAGGLDAELMDIPAEDPMRLLRPSAPLLLRVRDRAGVLAVLRLGANTATLLGPRGPAEVPLVPLQRALSGAMTGATSDAIAAVLGRVAVLGGRGRERADGIARMLLAPTLRGRSAGEGWSVRPLSIGIGQDLRATKIFRRAGAIVLGYLLQFALFLAIWREVGARSFAATAGTPSGAAASTNSGVHGWPWFFGLLAAWVIAQLLGSAAVSRLALDIGAVVRAGLLRGALRLDAGRMRAAGVGQLLGRALDADVLDVLALGGGVETVVGLFELLIGAGLLAWGAAPLGSVLALLLAVGALVGFGTVHARRLRGWNEQRRGLTHELVERMVGHRTVLIQDRPRARQRADDAALTRYDDLTRVLDRSEVWLGVFLPRAWLLVGLLVLAPAAWSAGGTTRPVATASLALSVGGVWLVYGALRRLGLALPMLSLAREAWRQIVPLLTPVPVAFSAPGHPGKPGTADNTRRDTPPSGGAGPSSSAPLLVVDNVSFQYPGRPMPVLRDVSLTVTAGDRILVEGISGGGKSTLAALMTGLKSPTSGMLRLRGRDQDAVGWASWRAAVGGAPQFHDNHVFGTDLLFNLLMGRRWPPRLEDVVAAERVCRELGLGALLDRMPAGLQQQVGETGWQLSHGERSRLFIARSLLQLLDARVLDESFAALDPETLDQVMAAVLERPEALIVIAHP